MKRIEIHRYTPEDKKRWDDAVERSKNGTFLHKRDYMEYHSDRFNDRSLIALDNRKRIVAILPANVADNTLYTHQGLTYGGWITAAKGFEMLDMMELWERWIDDLQASGINDVIYKPIPHIYHRYPAEEDLYTLFRCGAQLTSRLVSTTIDLTAPLPFDKTSRRKLKTLSGINFGTSNRVKDFWVILGQHLNEKFGAAPVHSIEEITLLQNRFPENIKFITAEENHDLLAGAVFFLTDQVVHLQYAASTERGRELNVFPALYRHVIDKMCGRARYLDFGTSNEQNGEVLNEGLIRHKCSLGGRATVYDTYSFKIQ